MPSIQEILQFNFSPITLNQSAQKIVPITLESLIDLRINKLQSVCDRVGISSFFSSSNNLIPQVFKKFKSSVNSDSIIFDKRELRTLTYSLYYSEKNLHSIFSNDDELEIALSLLNLSSNWKDSFLFGLIDCLLRNWETKYKKSLAYLGQFINSKLVNYSGNRNSLILFKTNKRFINLTNGDILLGDTIAKLKLPIKDATKFLGAPESWISYSYFSKVILTYYERISGKISDELENIDNVLKLHNISTTNKRVISKIIIQANRAENFELQDKIKKIAFNQIGDPGDMVKWSVFENANETEKSEVLTARNILNEWITRQFINVFFNVCINDDRRKKFWLKYTSNISNFKVYGPSHTKNLLKRDKRIAEYVDGRFEIVRSIKDVSAFILFIGDYMLIEFSNDGYACCAYKINSQNRPSLKYQLNSVDDLRNSGMSLAIESKGNYYYSSEEGRLFHNENWESKFNHWLNEKVIK